MEPSCGEGLPPDPVDVAPELDLTVATTLINATSFLYTGTNPIQTGVAPGTIEPRRAAVLRGKVFDSNGTPISGVQITILSPILPPGIATGLMVHLLMQSHPCSLNLK